MDMSQYKQRLELLENRVSSINDSLINLHQKLDVFLSSEVETKEEMLRFTQKILQQNSQLSEILRSQSSNNNNS